MDNRQVDVTSEGDEDLALALKIIWKNCGGKATHYKISKFVTDTKYGEGADGTKYHYDVIVECPQSDAVETLILLWHEEGNATPLPYPIDINGAVEFIKGWLKNVQYPGKPAIDGDSHKGWHLFCDHWGHVCNHHYGIVGVRPAWAMYGK